MTTDESPGICFESQASHAAQFLGVSEETLFDYYHDLENDRTFLEGINKKTARVPEFGGKIFHDVRELRVFRAMLYVVVRATRPTTMVETGVLNGFGSAFTLLAMAHNGHGTLHSIDIPPDDPRMSEQGTNPLPSGKSPGWLIPDNLRQRHRLQLGEAETLLPRLLAELGAGAGVDAFLHDSDHCYTHMIFELALAWRYLRFGGLLLCDNVEQNSAFFDLARAVEGTPLVLQSFASSTRRWEHGLLLRNHRR